MVIKGIGPRCGIENHVSVLAYDRYPELGRHKVRYSPVIRRLRYDIGIAGQAGLKDLGLVPPLCPQLENHQQDSKNGEYSCKICQELLFICYPFLLHSVPSR